MSSSPLVSLLKTSRPRFWPYLAGPFLLGIGNALPLLNKPIDWLFPVTWLLWWLFPANLFLYGVNDLFDEETDALNPKKETYETRVTNHSRQKTWRAVWVSAISGAILWFANCFFVPTQALWITLGFLGFLVLGHQYSALPLRLKSVPFLDSLSNILYTFPVFIGWGLRDASTSFPWLLLLAGALWCMAMHAFSAVPDMYADQKAGLQTIATKLGQTNTLILCFLLFSTASLLTYHWICWLSWIGVGIYACLLVAGFLSKKNETALFRVYRLFPFVNLLVGFGLWLLRVTR